jgi:L-ribulose-5-phosphate 3-epimerase
MITKHITAYAQQHYFLAEAGILQAKEDHASYWYIDGSLPEEYPENWSVQRIAALVAQIHLHTIHPIFHGNFKLPLSSDVSDVRESAVKAVLAEIDLSKELSAPLIIHGGAIVEPRLVIKAKKDALDNYLRSLDTIVSYAAQQGVTILLENLSNYKNYRPFHYIFTTPEEYKYVFDRIGDGHVHFFFDVGHGVICDGDPIAVIKEFSHRIWGMSFSNNDGVRDLHLGIWAFLGINQGLIDYQQVINAIVETNWRGVLAFEVRGRPFNQSVEDVVQLFAKVPIAEHA